MPWAKASSQQQAGAQAADATPHSDLVASCGRTATGRSRHRSRPVSGRRTGRSSLSRAVELSSSASNCSQRGCPRNGRGFLTVVVSVIRLKKDSMAVNVPGNESILEIIKV